MIHHIRQTADGFISALSALGLLTISSTTADWYMKVVTFFLGCIVSVLASIYYIIAIRKDRKGGKIEKVKRL